MSDCATGWAHKMRNSTVRLISVLPGRQRVWCASWNVNATRIHTIITIKSYISLDVFAQPGWKSFSCRLRCRRGHCCRHRWCTLDTVFATSARDSDTIWASESCWRAPAAFRLHRCSSSTDRSWQTSTPRHSPSETATSVPDDDARGGLA